MIADSITISGVKTLAGSSYYDRHVGVKRQCRLVNFPVNGNRYGGFKPIKTSIVSPPLNDTRLTYRNSIGCKGLMSGWHEIELTVREYELDQYRVVHNSVYSNYCQMVNCALLQRLGSKSYGIDHGEALALSELSLKFISPLKSGDRFLLRARISGMTGARLLLQDIIVKLPNQQVILDANASVVWLDKNYRPMRLPEEVRSNVNRFIAETHFEQDFRL